MGLMTNFSIFVAGHGYYDEKENLGYLLTKDTKKNDPNFDTYLLYGDLQLKYLKNISAINNKNNQARCRRMFVMLMLVMPEHSLTRPCSRCR